jgi:transketolase
MLEDVALMRSLPNMDVFAPLDATETEKIVTTLAISPSPTYLRLVRPPTPQLFNPHLNFTIGKSHVLQKGDDITVLGYGPILSSLFSITNLSLEIINCSSLKPIDDKTILTSVKKTSRCLVIEDHQQNGGLGEAVATLILSAGIKTKFIHLAVNNNFGQSAKDPQSLYDYYNLGSKNIIDALKKLL